MFVNYSKIDGYNPSTPLYRIFYQVSRLEIFHFRDSGISARARGRAQPPARPILRPRPPLRHAPRQTHFALAAAANCGRIEA